VLFAEALQLGHAVVVLFLGRIDGSRYLLERAVEVFADAANGLINLIELDEAGVAFVLAVDEVIDDFLTAGDFAGGQVIANGDVKLGLGGVDVGRFELPNSKGLVLTGFSLLDDRAQVGDQAVVSLDGLLLGLHGLSIRLAGGAVELGPFGGIERRVLRGGIGGLGGRVGGSTLFTGLGRKFAVLLDSAIDGLVAIRHGTVRVTRSPPAFQHFIQIVGKRLELAQNDGIDRLSFGRGQLCQPSLVLDERIASLILLLAQLVHFQIDIRRMNLIRLPASVVVRPEHPQGADREQHARDRKDAVHQGGIAPSGFSGRHAISAKFSMFSF
jgi:hypothetical protein